MSKSQRSTVVFIDERKYLVESTKRVVDAEQVTIAGDGVIVMNPGVPPLGSKAFDEWLKKKTAELNGRTI